MRPWATTDPTTWHPRSRTAWSKTDAVAVRSLDEPPATPIMRRRASSPSHFWESRDSRRTRGGCRVDAHICDLRASCVIHLFFSTANNIPHIALPCRFDFRCFLARSVPRSRTTRPDIGIRHTDYPPPYSSVKLYSPLRAARKRGRWSRDTLQSAWSRAAYS